MPLDHQAVKSQHILLSLIVLTLTLALPAEQAPAQSARYVLTSVEQNIDVGDWQITARETGVAPGVPWSVRRQRLHGGKQDGVDVDRDRQRTA